MSWATTSTIRVGIRSGRGPAAVEDDRGACHKRGFVGRQVDRQVRDFIWASHPANWLSGVELGDGLLTGVMVRAFDVRFYERAVDSPRADGVATNCVVAVVNRELFGHSDDGALRCAVGEAPRYADLARHRGDVHDDAAERILREHLVDRGA